MRHGEDMQSPLGQTTRTTHLPSMMKEFHALLYEWNHSKTLDEGVTWKHFKALVEGVTNNQKLEE